MSKKTKFLLLATVVIVAIVATVVVPGMIAEHRAAAGREQPSAEPEILCVQEADGSITYHVPLTRTNTETGEKETQWFTANSNHLPARILIQEGDAERCILFDVDENGNTSIKWTPTDSELEGMADA